MFGIEVPAKCVGAPVCETMYGLCGVVCVRVHRALTLAAPVYQSKTQIVTYPNVWLREQNKENQFSLFLEIQKPVWNRDVRW